eukprot:c10936_g1_i1 orf=587-3496(+)
MEIWILLAAAGSGYLAQYWQSSQKSKEVSIDIIDNDDDHCGSSTCTLPSRRRYRSLPSTKRRMKGSFYQNRLVSKFSQGVGKMTGGCVSSLYVPVADAEESHEAQAWHNCVIPDSCSRSSTNTQLDSKRDAAACLHSPYAISSSNIPSRCPALNTCNAPWPQKCCGFDFSQGNHEGDWLLPEKIASVSSEAVLDSQGCCMRTLYSAHCTEDSAMDENGFMLQDGPITNSINDALDNNAVNGEGAFLCDRTWIPGYLDSFLDFSALSTMDTLKMQEHEGRSSSSSRIRSHQSNEGNRSYTKRRRSLASCRLTTLPDSCLSVQSGDDYNQEVADSHIHNSLACEHLCNEEIKADASGNYLGEENGELLSSPSSISLRILNEIRNSESLVEEKKMDGDLKRSFRSGCLPFQIKSSGQEKARRECAAFLGGDNSESKGSGNNLLKVLLFNFGVGVGMMFAIMSNKHCTTQLIRLVEEALCVLKDLEGEVQGRKKLRFEFYNARDTREDVLAEQSHAVSKIVKRIIELVEQVRVSLSKDSASVSAVDYRQSKEMARLEAELEAELERMEMNLGVGDVSELCQRSSGVSEDDQEIGFLVQGELSARGIPCDDVEAHSEKGDGRDSSYEVIHGVVSPVELAKRLHEVLEDRQDRKILELEAEIKHLDSRLQAKEKEFQVWRQRVRRLLQDSTIESLSGFHQKGVCVKAEDKTKKVLFSSSQQEKHSFSTGMHHSAIVSPVSVACNEHFFSNGTKEASSLHQRGPHPKPCLGDEAYDEVCEEFFELWSDTATESPSCSQYGRLKGAPAELEQVPDTKDAANDTVASTPCSVKVTEARTVAHHHPEDQLNCNVEMEASSRKSHSDLECKGCLNLDWNGEGMRHPNTISLSQEKPAVCAQDVIDIFENHGQFGCVLDWSMSEDSSCSSELDEQLGQLLIKRIVEKSKRGSSIIEVAESVMASLDIDDTDLEIRVSRRLT